MIELTKLQNAKIVVNAELIEFVESTPDTLITTTTGKKLMVKESVEEVIEAVIAYKRRCAQLHEKGGNLRVCGSSAATTWPILTAPYPPDFRLFTPLPAPKFTHFTFRRRGT